MEYFEVVGDIHRVHSVGLHRRMVGAYADVWGMMVLQGTARAYDRSLDARSVGTGAAGLRDTPAKDSRLLRCSLFVNCTHHCALMSARQPVKSHRHSECCFLLNLVYCCPHLAQKDHDLLCSPSRHSHFVVGSWGMQDSSRRLVEVGEEGEGRRTLIHSLSRLLPHWTAAECYPSS